jgi:type II secretory pathway pseudopilin PulG
MRNSSSGFSLLETMIATGLLAAFIATSSVIYISIQKHTSDAARNSVANAEINNILDNIRTGVQNYQLNFDSTATPTTTLQTANLPMAWDVGVITTAAACPHCKGRYGFYIQPILSGSGSLTYPGLDMVYVRISNSDWPDPSYQDYQFVVSVK